MVDSIKTNTDLSKSQSAPKRNNSSALKENFKNLSSGLSVSEVLKEAPAVVQVQSYKNSTQVGKLVDNLNEAVKSSKETLQALEDVSAQASSPAGNELNVVKAFAEDLDELKSDIVDLLKDLRTRAGQAAVLNENIEAADSRVEDLEKAQAMASDASMGIQFDKETALSAHSFLSPGSVDRLLQEKEDGL